MKLLTKRRRLDMREEVRLDADPAVYHSHNTHVVRLGFFLCNVKRPESGKKLEEMDPECRVSERVLHLLSNRALA